MCLKERLLEVKNYINNNNMDMALEEIREIAWQYGKDEIVVDIVSTDKIDEIVYERLENDGWQGVACCLENIKYLNDDFYMRDGCGNLSQITKTHVEVWFNELESGLRLTSDIEEILIQIQEMKEEE